MFLPIEQYPHRICLDIVDSLKQYITNKICVTWVVELVIY